MHIDRANQVTVSREPANSACPISSLGLVFMPTHRTPARCSSFGAGEAHDVGGFGFVGEIVDILAIFPQGHPLIMVSGIIPIAHPMRIADEERTDLVLNAEVDDLPSRLMPQIEDTPLSSTALLVLRPLQFLPSARILLTTSLLLSNFAKVLITLSFERTDPTPGDDQGPLGRGGDCGQMDFAKINRCSVLSWSFLRLWNLDTHMQLKAVVPDQCTSSAVFRKLKR